MIVDVHTHTPTHRDPVPAEEESIFPGWRGGSPVRTTNSWADYDQATAAADVTIVFNIATPDPEADTGLRYDPDRTNDNTADFVRNDPARRIGFMSVDPNDPGVLDEIARCVGLGLVGIKLGANYQRFDPLSEAACRVYAEASRLGLPILFHQGASPIRQAPLRYAHPLVTDEVALRFPELRIVMGHMGHPWVRETVVTIRKHPHVYADVSSVFLRPWLCYEALTMADEWNVGYKLLLGSDFPVSGTADAIRLLRQVNQVAGGTSMPRISDEFLDGIVHADALTHLGLTS